MNDELDAIRINFNESAINSLNIALAFIMFGIALTLKKSEFTTLFKFPKAALFGVISQYIMLPALTFLLVILIKPTTSMALGMLLIAACPGGNVSNFFTYLSKGNVALSVSLSMFSTVLAFIVTPLQLQFWSSLLPETRELYRTIDIEAWKMIKVVFTIMILPLFAGMFFAKIWPLATEKIQKPTKIISFILLLAIIAGGLLANTEIFIKYYYRVVYIVFAHNSLALFVAFLIGVASNIGRASTKTISIETGIQNTGLGLVLVFNFFNGNGAMAIIVAWWGIWHIVSGFIVSHIFSKYYAS